MRGFPANCLWFSWALVISGGLANAQGVITTVAGTDWAFPRSGVRALSAPLGEVRGVAVDARGRVFLSDRVNHLVLQVATDGMLTVIAGNGGQGFSGDDGPATSAALNDPAGIAVDAAGNVFFADKLNHRIRKISSEGIITTVAGKGGIAGFSGDGGPATEAGLSQPDGIAFDNQGNLLIADTFNERIRKVSPQGIITTVAGKGSVPAFSGDGGPAAQAELGRPMAVALDAAGNLYIADSSNRRIRRIGLDGIITTVAGGGVGGDGGQATSAALSSPVGVALDRAGNLYIADDISYRIRRVTTAGIISTFAGSQPGFSGDGGAATAAWLRSPHHLVFDAAGMLYFADSLNGRVRTVNAAGTINTFAGGGQIGYGGDGGAAVGAFLQEPASVAADSNGNLYIADTGNMRIRKMTPDGNIRTVAGNGQAGFSGDEGPATSAALNRPSGVAVDAAGNLYIADTLNDRVRKVNGSGVISTVAGRQGATALGDGGPATSARLSIPSGVALDASGNLYIVDRGQNRVRKVTAAGTISTLAGTGTQGFSGDGGPAASAALAAPESVAVDAAGNLYITDTSNSRVRKVTPGGQISTVAGGGAGIALGDGGPATSAVLLQPTGVAVDSAGNLFIADTSHNRIRKVSLDGTISTVVGNGSGGFSGDGGSPTQASINGSRGVALDGAGRLFIADTTNNRVRMVRFDGTGARPEVTGVANAANYERRIASATWIAISGRNLSGATRMWGESDFTGGRLPTALDGVRVNVNGRPAFVYFISPNQVNALVDDGEASGVVPLEVITAQGKSDPVQVAINRYSPAFFKYAAQGGKYVIAHAPDGAYIGPPNIIEGVVTRPARPGEILTMYGTGFGPSDPAAPAGRIVAQPARLPSEVSIRIGFNEAVVSYAGLIGSGLYQFNLVVPALPDGTADGDQRVAAQIERFSSESEAWIPVKR
jgi:uncharacterized protein (TIGR03437 family)